MTRKEAEIELLRIAEEVNDEECPPRTYRKLKNRQAHLIRRMRLPFNHPDALEDEDASPSA